MELGRSRSATLQPSSFPSHPGRADQRYPLDLRAFTVLQRNLTFLICRKEKDAEKARREEGRICSGAEEWRKEEEMEGQMDGCCNGEWGGERGRLAGMGFASKRMRH